MEIESNSSKVEITEKEISQRKGKIKNFLFSWVTTNYDKAFIIILLIALALRIWVFLITKDQAAWFDAAEYLSTGKYWAGIGDMTDIWYYRRGFFWPLFCAIFFKLGLGEVSIGLVYLSLFSVGTIIVSYFLISNMFNKKYALLSSIGLSLSWVFLFFTARPSNEIPATFFLLLSLLFFWKGYEQKQGNKFIYLFAFFFTISVLVRMQNLMFIPVIFIFIFIKEKFALFKNKSLWISCLIFIIIMSPLFILYNQHFGNPIKDILSWYFGVGIGGEAPLRTYKFDTLSMYFLDLPYNLTKPIFYLFLIGCILFFLNLILGVDKLFKNKDIQNKLFILLWIVIPFLVLGYFGNPEQRYTLMQHPFLFMIAAIPLIKLGDLASDYIKINKKIIVIIIIIVFIISLIPNLLWANQLIENKKSSYYEVKLAGEWIKQNSNLGDMVITNSYPQISYYSERKVAAFDTCYYNPEDHKRCTSEEFEKFINDVKPRFMILSIFENHEKWMLDYPSKHNDIWRPVQAYEQNGQPTLIIYESNFK